MKIPTAPGSFFEYDSEGGTSARYSSLLDLDEDKNRPRIITETVGGIVTSIRYFEYSLDASGGRKEISEVAAGQSSAYGGAGNPRTVTVYYPEDGGVSSGRLKSALSPDGRLTTRTYEQGSFDVGTQVFTPGAGANERISTVRGTESSPAGIALKTTKEEAVSDNLGNALFQRTLVHDGSGCNPVGGRHTNMTISAG